MSTFVKIPLYLFLQTIYLLECLDSTNFDLCLQMDFDSVLYELNHKKSALELRDAYANIIKAPDEDSRHQARIRYLQQKRDFLGGN